MRQKLLLFISLLVLSSISSALAEDWDPEELPPLPISDIEENKEADGKDHLPFIDKIKNFFGFSKENVDTDESVISEAEVVEEPGEATSLESADSQLPVELVGSTEEGPVATPSISSSSQATIEDIPGANLPSDESKDQKEPASTPSDTALPAQEDNSSSVTTQKFEPSVVVPTITESKESDSAIDTSMQVDSSKKKDAEAIAAVSPPVASSAEGGSQGLSLPKGFEEFADTEKAGDVSLADSELSAPEDKNDSIDDDATLKNSESDPTNHSDLEETKKPDAETGVLVHGEITSQSGVSVPVEAILIENPEVELSVVDDNSAEQATGNAADIKSENQEVVRSNSDSIGQDTIQDSALTDNGDIQLEVPNYVSEVDKYTKELESKRENPQQVRKITDKELVSDNNKIEKFTDVTSAELDDSVLEFVNNEAQVLILPNDDVTEGKLTEEAKLSMMDFRSYTKFFWSNYYKVKREAQNYNIEEFIADYDSEHRVDYTHEDVIMSLEAAFKAIANGNINDLISILDSYPILQLTGEGHNTLLHEAAYIGNYPAAKLLILKGIDISAKNAYNQTALNVAKKYRNKDVVALLNSASFK